MNALISYFQQGLKLSILAWGLLASLALLHEGDVPDFLAEQGIFNHSVGPNIC